MTWKTKIVLGLVFLICVPGSIIIAIVAVVCYGINRAKHSDLIGKIKGG